ncbi:hypothetical protein BDV11DRAFT_195090, partial [Aspergillus similis]
FFVEKLAISSARFLPSATIQSLTFCTTLTLAFILQTLLFNLRRHFSNSLFTATKESQCNQIFSSNRAPHALPHVTRSRSSSKAVASPPAEWTWFFLEISPIPPLSTPIQSISEQYRKLKTKREAKNH